MKKTTGVVLGLVLAAAVGTGWWWHDKGGSNPAVGAGQSGPNSQSGPAGQSGKPGKGGGDRNRPVPAVTEAVKVSDVPVTLNALGTVAARQQAVVRARVDGLLQALTVDEGASVKAGQVLARIDARPFQAALASSQGQLAKDQAQLNVARLDLQRYRKLLAEDSIASQQVDAQAALVAQLEGSVASDQGNVASAQLNLSFATVVAPISGRVGLRQVDAGNMVHASDANGLMMITEIQPVAVVFSIPQENLGAVLARAPGKAGALAVEALDRGGKTVLDSGKLLAVDNQTDPSTGSTKLKAEFPNASSKLFPGQFVNVRLLVDTLRGALTVPQSAIQRGAPGIFVYVVGADKSASVRKVKLGPPSGERIVVEEGLQAGEVVVIDGADKLREGAMVTTVDAPPTGPGKGARGERGKGGKRNHDGASATSAPASATSASSAK